MLSSEILIFLPDHTSQYVSVAGWLHRAVAIVKELYKNRISLRPIYIHYARIMLLWQNPLFEDSLHWCGITRQGKYFCLMPEIKSISHFLPAMLVSTVMSKLDSDDLNEWHFWEKLEIIELCHWRRVRINAFLSFQIQEWKSQFEIVRRNRLES